MRLLFVREGEGRLSSKLNYESMVDGLYLGIAFFLAIAIAVFVGLSIEHWLHPSVAHV